MKHPLEKLASMDAAGISNLLGHPDEVQRVMKHFKELHSLKGKAREYAQQRVDEMLTPSVSQHSLSYLKEDAISHAKRQSAKGVAASTSPDSVMY